MLTYPLVAIVTLLALLLYFYMGLRVGQGRTKYGVAAPAVTGNPDFERAYRIQMNTLEWLPMFLVSLWLFAASWSSDLIAAAIGLVWILGRILYLTGYSQGGRGARTRLRHPGAGHRRAAVRRARPRSSGWSSTHGA